MRLKEYARSAKKRKQYVNQPALLLVGVDVSKAKHNACIGTQADISCRKFEFKHCRQGLGQERFFNARSCPHAGQKLIDL